MADRSIIIQGLIELQLKGQGGDQAVASMKKIVDQAKDVEKATSGIGSGATQAAGGVTKLDAAFTGLGTTIAAVFASRAIIEFLRDSYIGFARTERQALVTENQIRSLGNAANAETFRPFITSLSQATGILDDELIPAFQRAITVYRDYAAAQEAVTIASRFAEAGIGKVGSNVEALTKFFQTGNAQGLSPFISNLKSAEDGTASWAEVLPQLVASLDSLGAPLNDAQRKLDNVAVGMDFLRNTTGSLVEEMLNLGVRAIPTVLLGLSGIAGPVGIAATAALKKLDEAAQSSVDAFFNAENKIDAFSKVNAERDAERDKKKNEKIAEDALKAEQDRLAKVEDLNEQSAQLLLAQQIESTIAGTDERIAAELALNDRLEVAAVASAKKIGADTLAIEEFFQGERERIRNQRAAEDDAGLLGPGNIAGLKDFLSALEEQEEDYEAHQEELTRILEQGLLDRLQATVDLSPDGSQEKIDAQQALEKARLKVSAEQQIRAARGSADIISAINKNLSNSILALDNFIAKRKHDNKRQEISDELRNATVIAGVLGQTFAKHKAFAIAMAIVNTALGIASVWSDPSLISFYAKIAATLVVAASGLAQISAIRSANIGGGASAGAGVPSVASAPTQQAQQPSNQTVILSPDQINAVSGRGLLGATAGTIINIGTAFGDKQAMTKLAREINRINANDQGALR